MCGGLFGCGRGMIMVGLMVVLVGAVHGAGAEKDDTAARMAKVLESFANKGHNGSSQPEGRQGASFPTGPNDPFPCQLLADPMNRVVFLDHTQKPEQQAKAPYSRENWAKVIDECCPYTTSRECTFLDAALKVFANGGSNGGSSGGFNGGSNGGFNGGFNGGSNGGSSGGSNGNSNGGPPGKGPLTFGIILLITLTPLIPFF